MARAEIAGVVRGWQQNTDVEAVVWDGASSHRAEVVQETGFPLVQQPAYAPELNPPERFFEELRRAVEDKVYDTINAKMAAIEAQLQEWDADPQRVRRLVGWRWIMDTLGQPLLSETYVACSRRYGIMRNRLESGQMLSSRRAAAYRDHRRDSDTLRYSICADIAHGIV